MMNKPSSLRLRLRYRKDEVLQYIGHRDLLRLVMRLLRQADVPFASSGGFSPKPKVSFGPALPLGVLADNELVDFELLPGTTFAPNDILELGKNIADAAAPRQFFAGLELLPSGAASLTQCIHNGRYELEYAEDCTALRRLLARCCLPVEHKGKTVDLHAAISRWRQDGRILHIDGNANIQPVLNIVRLADYIEQHTGLPATRICRTHLLDSESHPL